ncbi:hypothetical protein [Halalkalibacillus halophilus]|uniref:hypothetical protein n=1 Tax=Halalkalibacillus halophilus TaxID=392827 RepID=UPI0004067812|nr:hypothetical protein [Halalkalibacillus halophilus]
MKRLFMLILVGTLLWNMSLSASADEVMDYRIAVEDHWYVVQDDYEYINLHYVLFTMDAVFTEDEAEREQWTSQVDETAAEELHEFFYAEELDNLEYTEEVRDYLEANFDVEEDEGGFFSAIGGFFRSIGNFFANLF